MNYKNNNKLFNAVVLVAILLITVLFYLLPVQSPFIFDDFYNLSGLGDIKEKGYLYYLLNNDFAGPTGRPITLLTFALQHDSWPYHSHQFKFINLLIHLLNGILIWFICKELLKHQQDNDLYKLLITALTTAIWLLHPMQLTTVLYTVQRMAQLSCLFSLIGIWGYLLARKHVVQHESFKSYVLLGIAVLLPTCLGVLSKENAILTLPLIVVIEFTIMHSVSRPRYWHRWAILILGLPILFLCVYFSVNFTATLNSFHFRDFTMAERLMTQPVILLNYLKDMLLPVYGSYTLYHDDFPVSRGLFEPWYTFPAMICMLLLSVFAVWQRKKRQIISFAILWFITAHLLESTFLNLELYFEHRNYLPSIAIYFALANGFIFLMTKISNIYVRVLLPSMYLFLILSILFFESALWRNPLVQATEWTRFHPTSVRSLNYLGNVYLNFNQYEKANDVYEKMKKTSPEVFLSVLQQQRIMSCKLNMDTSIEDWNKLFAKSVSAKPGGFEVLALLDIFLVETLKGECWPGTLQNFEILLTNLLDNKDFVFIRTYLYEFLAIINMLELNLPVALNYVDYSLLAENRPEMQVLRLRILEQMNKTDMIIQTLEELEREAGQNPVKQFKLEQIKNDYNQS